MKEKERWLEHIYSYNYSYFLVPASNENNLTYLFMTRTPEEEIKQFL